MGQIKKLLALDELPPREITNDATWTDLCENIHLHIRNLRLDMSGTEWAFLRAAVNHLGLAVEHTAHEHDYEEGDCNFLIQLIFNTPMDSNSDYYPNRATLELQRDNTVHFHYRDIRLHLTVQEFQTLVGLFLKAYKAFKNVKPFPYRHITEATLIQEMDIELIQPYDPSHLPGVIDEDHRKGIEYVKKLILKSKKIRPIVVDTDGNRLDGFKRYMAYRELGRKKIPCIVDPFAKMSAQENQSLLADEENDG